jgi:hypothetical protein
MFSSISAYAFRRRAIYSFLILFGGTVGFPFLIQYIVEMSSCRGIGGACGAVAIVAVAYSKSLLIFVSGGLYALSAIKRMRGVWSSAWFLFVIALVLTSFPLLFRLVNLFGANISAPLLTFQMLSLLKLLPLIVLTMLLSIPLEFKPRMQNGIIAMKGPGGLPIGYLYCVTAIFVSLAPLSSIMFLFGRPGPAMHFASRLLFSPFFDGFYASIANGLAGLVVFSLFLMDDERPPDSGVQSGRKQDIVKTKRPMFGA